MTVPADEMQVEQIHQTAILINSSPFTLSLFRKSPAQDDGAGGRKRPGPDVELEPQEVFLSGVTVEGGFIIRQEGEAWLERFIIIGMPPNDFGYPVNDIQKNDWFFVDDVKYKVVAIHPDRSYQIKGEVAAVTDGN